jgi:hypothetical protein
LPESDRRARTPSADIVLAKQRDRLYVLTRDAEYPEHLVSQGLDVDEVLELVRSIATPDGYREADTHANAEPSLPERIAKIRSTIIRRVRRGRRTAERSATP